MNYTLRKYQKAAFDEYCRLLKAGCRRPIFNSPTGSGKTVLACYVIERAVLKEKRVLVQVHRRELIDQCSRKLDENGLPHGIIQAGNPRVDQYARIQVASVQTMIRRLDVIRQDFDVVITDECHHAPSPSYRKILERSPRAFHIGLSATPYRADGQGMEPIFDCIITVATVSDLTDQGFLVPARVFEGVRVDLSRVPRAGHDYNQGRLDETMNTPKIVGNVVQAWIKNASDRLTVFFTPGVASSKSLAEAFAREGYNFAHLDGNTPGDERGKIHARMRAREICGICNCGVLTEGYDCPEISCIGLVRPTKSKSLCVQLWGRGLRPAVGKIDCILLDHANLRFTHGDVTDPVDVTLKGGTSNVRRRPERQCPSCGAKYAGAPSLCPVCGEALKRGEERLDEEIIQGDDRYEMRERHPTAGRRWRKWGAERAAAQYFADRATGRKRGYRRGWAEKLFEARTGEYPSRELEAQGDAAA